MGVRVLTSLMRTDFGNDDTAANLAVSDHRPVWAVFSIDGSDTPSIVQELPTADATPQIATVYVTKTGKKYHRETCRWGKDSDRVGGGETGI